ncbi:hypothetical protein K3758_07575 [Sulfitobacter sp. W002]|uniref:hypothetical protein n=1 Tax=Sulfitobacter sp. W002 TaxID=2867024 RepID=UPI0021A86C11|nr:hypothetical protein [Sulfitobacter sp. W002]UWR31354.1 hypothetical protein K3758_07575 [Sulfitobacter sp. W002]
MKENNGVLWSREGPRLEMKYQGGNPEYRYVLHINDLNPELDICWCFDRWTMVRIGLWFIRRALFAKLRSD